ncbi:MAG: hypothetical protein ACR2O6_16360 [Ilumatobacteraceae bacterium]
MSTEGDRLDGLSEDELADLLTRVRRLRNKYSDLDRRQSSAAIAKSGRRSVSSSSNERTARKAEVLADAVSRVSRYLSRAARQNANELKQARLDAARGEKAAPKRKPAATTSGSSRKSKSNKKIVPPARKGATSAANKRQQASRDSSARSK